MSENQYAYILKIRNRIKTCQYKIIGFVIKKANQLNYVFSDVPWAWKISLKFQIRFFLMNFACDRCLKFIFCRILKILDSRKYFINGINRVWFCLLSKSIGLADVKLKLNSELLALDLNLQLQCQIDKNLITPR